MPRSPAPIPLRHWMAMGALALAAALSGGGLTVLAVDPQTKLDDRPSPVAIEAYYDPTTKTGPDGTFTLKFIRPGEHYVQAGPFWLEARQAPEGTSRTVSVAPGQTVTGVELKGSP